MGVLRGGRRLGAADDTLAADWGFGLERLQVVVLRLRDGACLSTRHVARPLVVVHNRHVAVATHGRAAAPLMGRARALLPPRIACVEEGLQQHVRLRAQ